MKRAISRTSLLAAFLLLALGQNVFAGDPQRSADDVPKILLSGFEAYKVQGPDAALKAWIKGSAIDGSREALSQANNLRQIQDFYGPYKGFHVIQTRNLTPSTRVVYLTVDFDKGPLFAKFTLYQAESGWIVVNFIFNTKEEVILPHCP
jgi:hypothetical protein